MSNILFRGVILGAALTVGAAAHATVFSYDGIIDTYTVATTGTYSITVIGAAGGTGSYSSLGGEGADVQGTFSLTAGTILDVLVGQQGAAGLYGGGGGGGSFVVTSTGTPLAIAGGGGGGGYYLTGTADAGTSTSGQGPYGGTAGSGGDQDYTGGGGGLLTDGFDDYSEDAYGYSGSAFVNGGAGGAGNLDAEYDGDGGFGGGGGGGYYGGGGGGGYSGGSGAAYDYYNGYGGGSYLDASASDPVFAADASTGDGSVTIAETFSSVPEPASLVMLSGAIGLLGLVRRRKHPTATQA